MQSQSQERSKISDALAHLSEASKQTVESLRQSNTAIGQFDRGCARTTRWCREVHAPNLKACYAISRFFNWGRRYLRSTRHRWSRSLPLGDVSKFLARRRA